MTVDEFRALLANTDLFLYERSVDRKLVACFYFLRQWKTARIAALKGSSPQAIRKIKSADNGREYLPPAACAMPDLIAPLEDAKRMVLGAISTGLMVMGHLSEALLEQALLRFGATAAWSTRGSVWAWTAWSCTSPA